MQRVMETSDLMQTHRTMVQWEGSRDEYGNVSTRVKATNLGTDRVKTCGVLCRAVFLLCISFLWL
eukprot:7122477-Prymnesium_polylepis.1